jgi:hypothetical protein
MNLREVGKNEWHWPTRNQAWHPATVLKTATGPSRPNRIRTFEQFGILTSPAARSKTQELDLEGALGKNATRQAMYVQRNIKARLRNIVAV